MCLIDEGAQIIRCSVQPGGRKKINAIIAPAKFAGKVGDRHHFDDGNSDCSQLGQLLRGAAPGSFGVKVPMCIS